MWQMMMDICLVIHQLLYKILKLVIKYSEKIIVFVVHIFSIKVAINYLKIADIFLQKESTKKEIHNLIGAIDYFCQKNVHFLKIEEGCQF